MRSPIFIIASLHTHPYKYVWHTYPKYQNMNLLHSPYAVDLRALIPLKGAILLYLFIWMP